MKDVSAAAWAMKLPSRTVSGKIASILGSVGTIQGEERLRDIFTPEEPGAAEVVTSVCLSQQHPSFSKDQDDKKKRERERENQPSNSSSAAAAENEQWGAAHSLFHFIQPQWAKIPVQRNLSVEADILGARV
jgi:hypothetical protein